jgi:hypothetical protein
MIISVTHKGGFAGDIPLVTDLDLQEFGDDLAQQVERLAKTSAAAAAVGGREIGSDVRSYYELSIQDDSGPRTLIIPEGTPGAQQVTSLLSALGARGVRIT